MRADYRSLLVCLALGGLGCASEPASTGPRAESARGALGLAFDPMYSAYDGDAHRFRVPVRVDGAEGELEVSTSPPDFVDVEPSDDGVILTTRQAGTATVIITDGARRRGEARLIVTENGPDDVELGMQRYNDPWDGDYFPSGAEAGGVFSFPEGGIPEGGFRLPEGGLPSRTSHGPQSCVACHSPAARSAPTVSMPIDGEYTPQQIAGLSDDALIRIFTEGEKPEGALYRIASGDGRLADEMASDIFRRFHSFTIAPETSRALVAYLRQLEPTSRGELDFGGLYPGRSE